MPSSLFVFLYPRGCFFLIFLLRSALASYLNENVKRDNRLPLEEAAKKHRNDYKVTKTKDANQLLKKSMDDCKWLQNYSDIKQ